MKQVLIKWGCSEGEAEAMRPYDSRTRGSWLASKASLRKKQCTEKHQKHELKFSRWAKAGAGVLVKEGKIQPSGRRSLASVDVDLLTEQAWMDTETRATGSGQSILDIVGCIKSCQQRLYVKKKKKKKWKQSKKMIKNRISRSEDRQ